MKGTSFFCAGCIAFVFTGQASNTITFDPPSLPGGGKLIDSWSEQGFRFGAPALISQSISDPGYPWDGSGFLQAWSLSISRPDNRVFSLLGVDLAEYSTVYAFPMDVTFLGTRLNGSTVSATFTLDGIIDGNGPLLDFQQFQFPASFTDLKSVSVTGSNSEYSSLDFSIDNLRVDVPEPGVVSLAAVAVFLSLGRQWRGARKFHP